MLDRLAKIMSYMRPSERGKNAKKLRKKDKLAMLNGLPPGRGHQQSSRRWGC